MQGTSSVGLGGCPDFEDLSCYVDDELDAIRLGQVRDHVRSCQRCAGLTARLHDGFEDGVSVGGDGATSGSSCTGEEDLIVYLMGELGSVESASTEAHLSGCDACVYRLSLLRKRLRVEANVERAVPSAVRQRVSDLIASGTPAEAGGFAAPAPTWLHRIRDSLDRALRLPVLVPAAVAAGALMVIGVQTQDAGSGSSGVRAVQQVSVLRVTDGRALVRQSPRANGAVVGEVRRGDEIEVAGEERDWYRVLLAGGVMGWVEREAFE